MRRFVSILGPGLALLAGACGMDGAPPPPPSAQAARVSAAPAAPPPFTLFESGQVRPLALSRDGARLYAVNTPDNRLEIFDVDDDGLSHRGSVPVGLEPVAVAVRSEREVWVVNHLSDSVSIVDVANAHGARVVRTLLVGDEPRDIVFGGRDHDRAFITTAHRGQNSPRDPQLTTPGVGRADVWVFDAGHLGGSLGGTPLTIITLFADTPRALAVTPDGSRVYAAAFHSGNRTTTLNEGAVPDGGQAAGGLPAPNASLADPTLPQPEVGLVVKFNGTHWVDRLGRTWDNAVKFSLPDKDVFAIDATASPPAAVAGAAGVYRSVGTILFNMVVNPRNGKVYVSNTDAQNDVRFEGPGGGGSTVRGHLAESRITVLGPGSGAGTVAPRHLNKHIDYSVCCAAVPNAENEKSLAQPMGMALGDEGKTLYVAAFGSSKIGVFSTAQIESDSFVPNAARQIAVSGGGPTGLVLDDDGGRLYVLTRFDNSISVVNVHQRREVGHVRMHNPEPPSIVKGRRFLYDASLTSSHGDSACASCHIFGDFDSLAWDLGNPDGTLVNIPGPFVIPPVAGGLSNSFHPMKGPMTTQSLRGMANHGAMHWRGDRTGGNDAPSAQPDSGSFDEDAAFKKFNVAFPGLIGRSAELSDADMQAFTDFILQVTYPPNPIRALDNSLTSDQQAGRAFFFGGVSDGAVNCVGCHVLDPSGNASFGVARPGFFGSSGLYTFEGESQIFKVPHLRNLYQKVGMFGMPPTPLTAQLGRFVQDDTSFTGDQVRGFGFLHDGSVDTSFRFHGATVFIQTAANPGGIPFGPAGQPLRRQIEQFMLAFDSNLAPIVGQQVTLTRHNGAAAGPRIDLLIARAALGECDLVVKGRLDGREAGFLYDGAGAFQRDRAGAPHIADAALRDLASEPGQELTYTCVPPGSGQRIGLDRDADGNLDGDRDENDDR